MIKNLIGPLTVDQKINLIVIILALFISTFVEIISIGIVPVFLTALLVPEKIPNFINELIYVDQLFTLSEKNLILYGSIILLLIFIIKNIFLFILVFYEKNFLRKINISNASNLFKYFIESNLMFHLQRNSSELYSIISNVNEQYVEYIRCSILLVKESLIILSIFLILFYYQTNITLLIFGIFLIFTSIYFLIFRKILIKRGTIRQQFCDAQVKTMYESFGSIKESKILKIEDFFINKFVNETKGKEFQQMYLQIIQSIPRLIIEILIVFFIIIIIFFFYINNYTINSFLPILSFFTISAIRLMPAFNSLIFSSTSLKFLSNSLKIINREIGNIQVKQINKSHKNKKINFKKEIILNNISFSYPNTNKGAIIDINLKINHGEINGLIGKSGAGKSTLVDLILGLHKASKGVITSDGIDIQTNLFSWFDLLGYVPQDIYLSDDTILNNIAYGVKPELIDLKKVKEVIKLSQLELFVNSLPDGYNSKVGDRGRRISAGQKQRIGIARALYKNSQILILDEATSSLDHETERDFIKTIVDINKYNKVTIILIAHKLNTIKICDKLYLIKNGKLIDKGNNEYIMSNHQYLNDYYKDNK